MKAARRTDWQAVTLEAVREPAALLRALADMGFDRYLGHTTRGALDWFPPAYLTAPGNSPHRACMGRVNRNLRDATVHLLQHAGVTFAVCSYRGEWRTEDGAQRGEDLASLGAVRWRCTTGKAAVRIARTIGLDRIPEITPMTPTEVFARMREPATAPAMREQAATSAKEAA